MQTVMTNSGVELRVESNIIYTTDSKAFWRSGNMLVGNGTVISYQCRSMDEAVDMVAALYNGRKTEAAQAYTILRVFFAAFKKIGTPAQCRHTDIRRPNIAAQPSPFRFEHSFLLPGCANGIHL